MIHKKLLSLLVLLMTAASGAWAQTQITITQGFEDGMGDWTTNNCHSNSRVIDNESYSPTHSGTNMFRFYYTSDVPQYLISPEIDAADGGTMSFYYARYSDSYEESFKVGYSTTTNDPTAFTWGDEVTCTNKYNSDGYLEYTYDIPAGTKYVSIACTSDDHFYLFVDDIKIEYAAEAPTDVEVNTNAEEGETFFTEAWFTMPTFDATVNYDIVRDMADTDNPVEFSGLSPKVVVKKKTDSDAYEPLSELNIQLIDQLAATDAQNIIAADGIKVKVLKGTDNNGTITYDETNTLTLAEFTANMEPGYYKIVAEPTDATTSPYIGTASLAFQTLAGYPVEVAANGFVTYYSDENLTVEESSAAQLYTITNVSGNTAIATEIASANAGMPFLIFNSTDEPQTFLLIPTENEINQSVYPGFKGTLEGKTFTAVEMAATDHYVVNNAQFVWVKDPGTIAAHRSWLELTKNSAARAITILFGDATAIGAVSGSPADNGDIYDLNGRKVGSTFNVQRSTLKKGVYIQNGKKVVNK